MKFTTTILSLAVAGVMAAPVPTTPSSAEIKTAIETLIKNRIHDLLHPKIKREDGSVDVGGAEFSDVPEAIAEGAGEIALDVLQALFSGWTKVKRDGVDVEDVPEGVAEGAGEIALDVIEAMFEGWTKVKRNEDDSVEVGGVEFSDVSEGVAEGAGEIALTILETIFSGWTR